MNIIKTDIEGVLIIEPEFEEKVAPILGHSVHFSQDNESMSSIA